MKSRLAEELRREHIERVLAMTPAERVALALELGEQAIADYMVNFGVDRPEAVQRLKKASQAGRRPSVCND